MHHFGMMVDDLEAAIKNYESLGFEVFKRFEKPGMKAAMLFKDGAGIEFFEMENPEGETEQMIRKHSAFESDDIEADIARFVELGYRLAIPISPGTVVKRFAYLEDSAGNYIELCEP